MFRLFIALLRCSKSLATKCISLNDESCLLGPILLNLNPNELDYYSFMVSSDGCNGRCNIPDDPSGRICVPNKIEHVYLNISYDCKCKFDGSKCNSHQRWKKTSVDVNLKIQ